MNLILRPDFKYRLLVSKLLFMGMSINCWAKLAEEEARVGLPGESDDSLLASPLCDLLFLPP